MTDPERAARMDTPDLGEWDDMLPEPGRHPLLKLIALNLPPVAMLGAAAHAGLLDTLVDPLLGGWVGSIGLVYLWAVGALACGNRDLAGWIRTRIADLGMLGTLVGFALVLAAVVLGSDLESTRTGIADLTQGMSLALYTTIAALGFRLLLDGQIRWCR